MSNRGRSTTGEAAVPYYLNTPSKEAAKFLRLQVTRYLSDRASVAEVESAFASFQAQVRSERLAKAKPSDPCRADITNHPQDPAEVRLACELAEDE